jgi:hypothetical protein
VAYIAVQLMFTAKDRVKTIFQTNNNISSKFVL